MALAPFKHPSVFVGCPYTPRRAFEKLREALDRLPIEFVYADSSIRTQQVMERIRRRITRTDYGLFDITDWNANVTLEVGMAEGLNKDYCTLPAPGLASADPPAQEGHVDSGWPGRNFVWIVSDEAEDPAHSAGRKKSRNSGLPSWNRQPQPLRLV